MDFIGIDFGTSNSLASLVLNDKIEFVEYPDGGRSNPTLLYFPAKEKKHYIGNEAVHRYLEHIEEGGAGGRLMLSIKTLLPDAKFDQTIVAGHGRMTAEDLVARYVSTLKQMAERQFSKQFDGVVMGRPVHFTELAVSRLEAAARAAGFKEVIFWLEPVAAALAYEMTAIEEDELICVVDIGGGTSDVCVIETSPARSFSPDRLGDIKSVGGIYQAGDELSAQIMKHRLAPRFGAGSTYTSLGETLPFPVYLTNRLAKWHKINLLNNVGAKETIRSIVPYSDRPEDVERLFNLIVHQYGFELFRSIDDAKKQLSEQPTAVVKFRPLDLNERIELTDFEKMIALVVRNIGKSIETSLDDAAVKSADIKKVILTGGSSQVPLINRAVIDIFGREKIIRPDFFSSVATGLGYAASRFK